jgi:hypothetical protein
MALDPRYRSASHCHRRTGGMQWLTLRGRCITSPNGEQSGFPGTTGDESSQQYTSVLRAVSYREVGSGLHQMRQPETRWHTCQRGSRTKEPPHVVNYSATHRKPESVRRSPKPSGEPGRRVAVCGNEGGFLGITKGGQYSFHNELYHTPSTRGRLGLVNKPNSCQEQEVAYAPMILSRHKGFAECLWHRTEVQHRRGSSNPEASCVSAVEHMVLGLGAGIALSPMDRQKTT